MTKEFNFYDRIDEIFEQGMPTRAQIYDAFNKAVDAVIAERMPTRDMLEEAFEAGESYGGVIYGVCFDGVDFETWYCDKMKGDDK